MKNKTYIIAEAGVNHNGNIEIAKKLVQKAKYCGANAVKFQTFKAKNVVTKNAQKSQYQKETTDSVETQFSMIKKLELTHEDHKLLYSYCNRVGIDFLSSPFDIQSIEFLNNLGLKTLKIPSGEIVNLPYLRVIGQLRKKLILSTGMSRLGEIEAALDVLVSMGTQRKNISLLHCITDYPAQVEDVNLLALRTLKYAFPEISIGYSDHTNGIDIPIAAVSLGATIIEKHFTLDKTLQGPDHKASLDPKEFLQMTKAIRNVEIAFGNGIKKISIGELNNIDSIRKSIVAAKKISKDEIFSEDNLAVKRPGNGVSPMRWDEIVGSKAKKDYNEDEQIVL